MNSDLKHDREYTIKLGQDLFQQWYVVIIFGRYGIWATTKTKLFDTRQDAYNYIDSKLRRRLSSLKRIGCLYQIVSFKGTGEILETINKNVIDRFSWFKGNET